MFRKLNKTAIMKNKTIHLVLVCVRPFCPIRVVHFSITCPRVFSSMLVMLAAISAYIRCLICL